MYSCVTLFDVVDRASLVLPCKFLLGLLSVVVNCIQSGFDFHLRLDVEKCSALPFNRAKWGCNEFALNFARPNQPENKNNINTISDIYNIIKFFIC